MADSQTRTLKLNVVGDTSSGRKALDDLAGKGDETGGHIGKAFGELFSTLGSVGGGVLGPLSEGFGIVGDSVTRLGEKHVDLAGKLAIGGGAIAGIGAALMGLGSADAQATAQLKQSIENVGGSYDEFKDKVDEAIKHQENFGHSAADTTTALQKLTDATHDPQKALDMLQGAADLAAAKHEDLQTAVGQVVQIMEGKGKKVLAAYGLQTADVKTTTADLEKAQKDVADATDKLAAAQKRLSDLQAVDAGKKKLTISDQIALRDAQQAVTTASDDLSTAQGNLTSAQQANSTATQDQQTKVDQLAEHTKGQASASVDSFTGKLKVLNTHIEDAAAKLGQKFGPAATIAGAVISTTASLVDVGSVIMGRFSKAQREAALASEGLTGATELQTTATEEATVAEGFALGPVLLIIGAVALLGIGIYELATHWSTVWGAMKTAAIDTWHFLDTEVVQPIKGVPEDIRRHWQIITQILAGPFAPAVKEIEDHWNGIEDFFRKAPGRLASLGVHMWDWISGDFRGAIDAVIRAWNGLRFTLPSLDWGPIHIGGFSIGVPSIPLLDTGGIVTGPTLAALAMNSVPEAVIPLPMLNSMVDNSRKHGDVNISVQAQTNADANQIAQEAAWQFKTMPKAS